MIFVVISEYNPYFVTLLVVFTIVKMSFSQFRYTGSDCGEAVLKGQIFRSSSIKRV